MFSLSMSLNRGLNSFGQKSLTLISAGKHERRRMDSRNECTTNIFQARIWIVYTQKTEVKTRANWMFHILEPSPEGDMIAGQENALRGKIRRDHYLPGTLEVYAIWTENDVEIARSSPVSVEVLVGSSPPATTRPVSDR